MNTKVKKLICEKLNEINKQYDEFLFDVNGNDEIFSVKNASVVNNNVLSNKVIYLLGSSVTFGACSKEEGMGEFIAKRNNCTCRKEAVSGTTLSNVYPNSYVERLLKTDKFDKNEKVDLFICQLSTNDMWEEKVKNRGEVKINQFDNFDIDTTYGAIEYIISYVDKIWHCPICFYTGSYFDNKVYLEMVDCLKTIVKKWEGRVDVNIINLFDDTEFNDIGEELKKKLMVDPVHPNRCGYQFWWVPKFEDDMIKIIDRES